MRGVDAVGNREGANDVEEGTGRSLVVAVLKPVGIRIEDLLKTYDRTRDKIGTRLDVHARKESDEIGFLNKIAGCIRVVDNNCSNEFLERYIEILTNRINRSRTSVGHDDTLLQEVLERHLVLAGQRMRTAHDSRKMKRNGRHGFDILILVCSIHGKGEIDLVVSEHSVEQMCLRIDKIKADIGMQLEHTSCSFAYIWLDKVADANIELSTKDSVRIRDVFASIINSRENATGMDKKIFASLGELKMRATMKKWSIEFYLQRLNLLRDGRLSKIAATRGLRE